ESFDFLLNLKVPFIKIGSGDSNNLLYIKYAATKKVPLIVSTGMIEKATVTSIYDIISSHHKQFCLLHCVSAYPTPYEDCNLRVIQDYRNSYDVPVGYSGHELGINVAIAAVALGAKTLQILNNPTPYEDCNLRVIQDYRNSYDVPVGYSGHELGINVAIAAVALGAKVLEKHITLDKSMKGTDHVCSLTPTEFQQLVRDVRVIEAALGNPIKKVVTSEIPCIDKLQKSLVMGSTKNKGEILYPGDVKIKVAEPKGLNALHFEEVIYKTLVYDKKEDEPLNEGDFC
ncbi:Sialic acid synthase, partial [Papilio machaon]